MSKLQKFDKPKISQKISTRAPPTEISDESMIFGIIHRLVKIFGRRSSSRDLLTYFWFVVFLEFGHVGHKGLRHINFFDKTFLEIEIIHNFDVTELCLKCVWACAYLVVHITQVYRLW